MTVKLRCLGYLLVVYLIVLQNLTGIVTNVYAQEVEEFVNWSIETSKKSFYPGEPLLLTLKIINTGIQEERIYFGAGGIGAFSMEIYDNSNKIMAKGGRIRRGGPASRGVVVTIQPSNIGQKSIVLNRWCSTLLPPGKYHVVCHVEYLLRSEATRIPGTEKGLKAGPIHSIKLELDIEIVTLDNLKFKKMLEGFAAHKPRKEGQSFSEWKKEIYMAKQMLALTQSELAVPYQLHLLTTARLTSLKWDAIKSLAGSGTIEAAIGLVQIMKEDSVYKEDMKRELIDAVYRLRETGKSDIINATNEFVLKYKRPIPAKTTD